MYNTLTCSRLRLSRSPFHLAHNFDNRNNQQSGLHTIYIVFIYIFSQFGHIFRVVSAVALKKFQNVFHLLIVERELQPYAHLNASSPTWHTYSTLNYFDVHGANVREGIDYFTLTWENRTLNLDTVELPAGKVVTGVRFQVRNGAIGLEVLGTDFDLTTGQLKNLEASHWFGQSTTVMHEEIPLDNLDVPILTPEKSIPHSIPNGSVKFGPSDKFKDLSQTTIPFIDAQLVESNNPIALSGVGLYYKSFPGYGGFVAPKVLNYNFAPHIAALLPKRA